MEEHAKSSTIRDLTQGPLVRQLLLFALPIMGANLLQSLYTLVDLWAVGNFASEAAISAVPIPGRSYFSSTRWASAWATAARCSSPSRWEPRTSAG